ncbi:hypothetical protein [Shinella zoogloeoides]|uniref:hypothetical protein n=1 Tax=Shinella zoogloeoides TaxID=352475 RepID=UPI00299E2C46|nr:hypothetical protein [Shinella zoogloeoides]WPE19876.1 hypothetical protein ShzoTeo12_10520 [Shinella zoogloeoides]
MTDYSPPELPTSSGRNNILFLVSTGILKEVGITPCDAPLLGCVPNSFHCFDLREELSTIPPGHCRLVDTSNVGEILLGGPEDDSSNVLHGTHDFDQYANSHLLSMCEFDFSQCV